MASADVIVVTRSTRVLAESRKLEQVNEAFADVLTGKVPARMVFEF